MTLRVGIVGAGTTGLSTSRRLESYPDVRIVAVADPNRPARDAFAKTFDLKLAASGHRRLAADDKIDLIYVCSPPATHSAVAVDCLKSGKHVICQQPMAVSMADAEKMIQAAHDSSKKLFIALPQRYDPANQLATKLVEEDEIGYPFLTLAACLVNEFDRLNDWHDWKGSWDTGGGGILIERGCDMMDLFHCLLGEVGAVSAVCTRFAIEPLHKAEDSCLLGLEFADDVTAELAMTGAARYSTWPAKYAGTAVRVEILGLEGSIRISNSDPRLIIVTRKGGYRTMGASDIKGDLPTDMDRDFLDCILEDRAPLVTPEHARDALKVVLAAYKSSQMKRRVEMIEYL